MRGSTYHLPIDRHSHRRGYTSAMSTISIYIIVSWNHVTGTKKLSVFIHGLKIRNGIKTFPSSVQHHNQHPVAIKTQLMQLVPIMEGDLRPCRTIVIQAVEVQVILQHTSLIGRHCLILAVHAIQHIRGNRGNRRVGKRQAFDAFQGHRVGTINYHSILPFRLGQDPDIAIYSTDLLFILRVHREILFCNGNIVSGLVVYGPQ